MPVSELETVFAEKFGEQIGIIAGVSTREYLQRKQNVFSFESATDVAFLQQSILTGPPIADPNAPKDENFVIDEFERLIEDLGPICYVSALCGKFIQRNGLSVTSITSVRPLDLLKRNPNRFVIVGGGNVTLAKFKDLPEVTTAMLSTTGKSQRAARAALDAQTPVPEMVTEQDVINEFKRLILQDGAESVYISSLCGRFLQRFKKPVTHIINSRPADFLRKYPEIFNLVGGGNVTLTRQAIEKAIADAARGGFALGDYELGGEYPADDFEEEVVEVVQGDVVSVAECTEADDSFDDEPFSEEECEKLLRFIAPPGHAEGLKARAMDLCSLLRDRSFLTIEDAVLGGAAGKTLAVKGGIEDTEIILLVDRLPGSDHEKWLPHILETLMAVLEMGLGSRGRNYRTCGGPKAELLLEGEKGIPDSPTLLVAITIAQAMGPREVLFQQLRECKDQVLLQFLAPALARDAVELVARQPPNVIAAMKLLRWWLAQQTWRPKCQPPCYLLELLVMNAALTQLPPAQQTPMQTRHIDSSRPVSELLDAALDACERLRQLNLQWEFTGMALFGPSEVDPELLEQAPVILDPANPCINVANPSNFDCSELVARAGKRGRVRVFRTGLALWVAQMQ